MSERVYWALQWRLNHWWFHSDDIGWQPSTKGRRKFTTREAARNRAVSGGMYEFIRIVRVTGRPKTKSLSLDAYQQASSRTLNQAHTPTESLCNHALGLGGEAGEVLEPIKKHLFHGKELDKDHVATELGDVLWYAAALATTLGLSLGDVAQANIDKLRLRWPGKFGETP